MKSTQFRVTLSVIVLGALSRLLPHPPNVTPLAAMALLGGAFLEGWTAALAPLGALFLSDLVLGLHASMPFVYAGFLATVWIGRNFLGERSGGRVLGACLASSTVFFLASNLGVWATSALYPHTAAGLATCYTAAIPFFRNSMLGDLAFTGLLFGLQAFGARWVAAPAATA